MPIIYLSPSTQEGNYYVTGGSEEYHMNLLADAMVPYLYSCGIRYTRNTPEMTAASSIRQANEGNYDFYLALHSNAAGEGNYGGVRGIITFYAPNSPQGRRGAQLIADQLKGVYPYPGLVRAQPTTTLGEVTQPIAPACLAEIGYHDNRGDALWLQENLVPIAQALVRALTEYFDIPFVWPMDPLDARVHTGSGNLNLRSKPDLRAPVLARLPDGSPLRLWGRYGEWYVAQAGDETGYVLADYVGV